MGNGSWKEEVQVQTTAQMPGERDKGGLGQWVLKLRNLEKTLGNYLETFLVVPLCVDGCHWHLVGEDLDVLLNYDTLVLTPQQRIIWPEIQIVPKTGNPCSDCGV